MPYTPDHKERTRQRILDHARRLFRAKGFDATSIDEIMLACKLTRGGFYAHFRSKALLYQEAMGSAAAWRAAAGSTPGERASRWFDGLLASCMPAFTSGQESASPWTFLAADTASQAPEVRAAYARAFDGLCQRLRRDLSHASADHHAALAAMAMAVGALSVAMSIDDGALRANLIHACREHARTLFDNPAATDRLEFFWMAGPRDDARGLASLRPVH